MLHPAARAQAGYGPSGRILLFTCAQPPGRFLFEEVRRVACLHPTLCACLHSTLDTSTLCYIFIYPRFACDAACRIVGGISRLIPFSLESQRRILGRPWIWKIKRSWGSG
jgi:hypothetical protein